MKRVLMFKLLMLCVTLVMLLGICSIPVLAGDTTVEGKNFKGGYSNPVNPPTGGGLRESSGYGEARGGGTTHNGVDYDGYYDDEGTFTPFSDPGANKDVYPTRDGVVEDVYDDKAGGRVVVVKHADGTYSAYAHLEPSNPVKKGDSVTTTTKIGTVDNTGTNTTGSHLHYEEFTKDAQGNETPVDPSGHIGSTTIADTAKPKNKPGFPKLTKKKNADNTYTVHWTDECTDNLSLKEATLKVDGVAAGTVKIDNGTGNMTTGTVKISINTQLNASHTVEIEITDCAGNKFVKAAHTFKVVATIPDVAFHMDFENGDSGEMTVAMYDGVCGWDVVFDPEFDSGYVATSTPPGCAGSPVYAGLQTPPIDFTAIDLPIYLYWRNSGDWSGLYDSCLVRLSTDGGESWHPLFGNYFDGNTFTAPFSRIIDVTRYRDSPDVIIEFLTRSAESSEPWVVDDIMVYSASAGTIPTLTEWGLIIMGVVFLAGVLWFVRRRRKDLAAA